MEIPIKYTIDISKWKRRDHYNFFRTFDQPFFGVTTLINCTEAYKYCKGYKVPFFLYYLHKSLSAVNHIKEFRYRIENNDVVEYNQISGSITVLRNDETFGFVYINYYPELKTFIKEAKELIKSEKAASGLKLKYNLTNLIHYSILPYTNFSSMQHAQMLRTDDSVPKIVFGKLVFEKQQVLLPISVHLHHALCDGLHLGKFLEEFERRMQITSS